MEIKIDTMNIILRVTLAVFLLCGVAYGQDVYDSF